MLKVYLAILLIVFAPATNAQRKQKPTAKVDTAYSNLKLENKELRAAIDDLKANTETQYEHLGYQIDAATYTLAIFSIVLTIVGVFLGLYVSNIWGKIQESEIIMRDHANTASSAEKSVKDFFSEIEKEGTGLLEQLREHETSISFSNLDKRPESFNKYRYLMFSRSLRPGYYSRLKKLYIQCSLLEMPQDLIDSYRAAIFFQFPESVVSDGGINRTFYKGFQNVLTIAASEDPIYELMRKSISMYFETNLLERANILPLLGAYVLGKFGVEVGNVQAAIMPLVYGAGPIENLYALYKEIKKLRSDPVTVCNFLDEIAWHIETNRGNNLPDFNHVQENAQLQIMRNNDPQPDDI